MATIDRDRLSQELPLFAADGEIEAQAKAILRLLLDPDLIAPGGPVQVDPATCPNCAVTVESTRSPYCGDDCREISAFVRQFRAGLQLGWLLDPEKQTALGQTLWHLLGGGRPLRQSIVLPRAKESVIKRDKGVCPCGEPATTVDHIRTACNRPINLRAVCEACSTDIPFGDARVTARPEYVATLQELATRIFAPEPIRCCDDAETWDWRAYLNQRKQN